MLVLPNPSLSQRAPYPELRLYIFLKCFSTVFTEITKCAAMLLLSSPSVTQCNTSRSRTVKPSQRLRTSSLQRWARSICSLSKKISPRASAIHIAQAMDDMMKGFGGKIEMGELVTRERSAGRLLSQAVYARWER